MIDDDSAQPESTAPEAADRRRVVSASVTLGVAVGVTALSFGLAAVSAGA
ncbi:MAG: hypothetical protein RL507_713, partial [Actinomycetota bacterium]